MIPSVEQIAGMSAEEVHAAWTRLLAQASSNRPSPWTQIPLPACQVCGSALMCEKGITTLVRWVCPQCSANRE